MDGLRSASVGLCLQKYRPIGELIAIRRWKMPRDHPPHRADTFDCRLFRRAQGEQLLHLLTDITPFLLLNHRPERRRETPDDLGSSGLDRGRA